MGKSNYRFQRYIAPRHKSMCREFVGLSSRINTGNNRRTASANTFNDLEYIDKREMAITGVRWWGGQNTVK